MKIVGACLLLMMSASYAQAPELAVCSEGQCVIPEATYVGLKMIVARMIRADQENSAQLDRALHRLQSCEAMLKDSRS